jgi:aminoglycoside 6-adenylyltransferase
VNHTMQAYEALAQRFLAWASPRDDVRAAVIVGSRARADPPADEWSDLDMLIYAHDPQPYLADSDWLAVLGHPWLTFLEPTPDGRGTERRVLLKGGLDVDLVFFPASILQQVLDAGVPPDAVGIFQRGTRILLDKDHVAERILGAMPAVRPAPRPSQGEFHDLVSDFWYHTVWTAKKLRRGELWTAKGCCDVYMKWRLQTLIEWHARATHGADYDTWHAGRFLEQWADVRVVQALPRIYAHYDADDLWRALQATMELFRWVALETADRLHYAYPMLGAAEAAAHVERLGAERQAPPFSGR